MKKALFITIEGIEGVGKSTASTYLRDYLRSANHEVVLTREPGGTLIAEDIRKLLLTPHSHETITSDAELLLMFAARSQHIHHVILPALLVGNCVISDRFVDASYAYQGGGRGFDYAHIQLLDQWIASAVKPDVTVLLDAPPELALNRAKQRGPQDRIEQEKVDFFERVREAYLARAKADPDRFWIVDAMQSIETVQLELKKIMETCTRVLY